MTYENYKIEDYLQGLTVQDRYTQEVKLGPSAAIVDFKQQCSMLDAAEARLESSLHDIRHLLQADLFDSEIEGAEHLSKAKFVSAAGALDGVVLERHLAEVH